MQEKHEQAQAEQPVHHRRDASQVDDGQPDSAGEPGVAGVFGQVDGASYPHRDRRQRCAQREQQRADDSRKDAPCLHPVAGHARQEFPTDGLDTPYYNDPDDEQNRNHHNQRGQDQQDEAKALHQIAVHQRSPPRRCFLKIDEAAARLITKVKTKRMMPIPKRAW